MHRVTLKGGKSFLCESNESIITGALRNGIFLEHSCMLGRCSSCKCKLISGETIPEIQDDVLSEDDRSKGFILSCIHSPKSDVEISLEDLSIYGLSRAKTLPAKVSEINFLTEEIILVKLRFPPTQKPVFLEGQYVNVIKGNLKRSYSIASANTNQEFELIIKNYSGGQMSRYWFHDAKINDLLRIEVPLGTFFLRQHFHLDNLVFLATGTGIAPIKSITENPAFRNQILNFNRVILLWGMKYENEIFWAPNVNIEFMPVLSRVAHPKKYVQDVLKELNLDFNKTAIYACGSNSMINDSMAIAFQNGIQKDNFFSDAFVASN